MSINPQATPIGSKTMPIGSQATPIGSNGHPISWHDMSIGSNSRKTKIRDDVARLVGNRETNSKKTTTSKMNVGRARHSSPTPSFEGIEPTLVRAGGGGGLQEGDDEDLSDGSGGNGNGNGNDKDGVGD